MATSIDEIPLPAGVAGSLFATGIAAVGPDPAGALTSVEADTLVCLIRDDEIELLFPEYGTWIASTDRVLRLPIPDFGIPTEDEMVEFVDVLTARLRAGERLVVHCRGGIGRTSLVCASVLMQLGYDHDGSLEQVGKHRIGAGPETPEQVTFLQGLAPRLAQVDR